MKINMSEKKEHPVCRYCGSENVSTDATVRYNKQMNDWELTATHNGGYCDDCNAEQKYFDWVATDEDDSQPPA